MKTQILKVSLIIVLGIISISLNAQNTKSVHVGLFNNKLSDQVAIKVNHISHDLANEMDKMKQLIKFSPISIENETFEANIETTSDYISALQEMELSVKFNPENMDENSVSYLETAEDFKVVVEELENVVKYRPSLEPIEQNIISNDLEMITRDLASSVKFQPTEEI